MNNIYTNIAEAWRNNKCKGCCILLEPYNPAILIEYIIKRSIEKNPNIKIIILVKDFGVRCNIVNYLKENNISSDNYTCLTDRYIRNNIRYDYDLAFYVGLDDYLAANHINCRVKYGLFIITTDNLYSKARDEIYAHFPVLNQADYEAKKTARYSFPVEEVHVGVQFNNSKDKDKYDEYTDYITKTINIFGSFENINRARVGDKTTGQSAEVVRLSIAQYNGWNENLDTTIPFNKQIDALFNPIALEEKCSTAYNIIRERNSLVNNNVDKIPILINLLNNELKDKKVVVVSKNGVLASAVYEALIENNITCGEYHNDIEGRAIYDNDSQDWIRYKTGVHKGEVKIFQSKAISSLSEQAFNENNIRVLSIKNHSSDALKIACNAIIFMSPNCFNIKEFLYRYNNITFIDNNIKVYKLYMIGTNEEMEVNKTKPMNNLHQIKNIDNTDKFNVESFGN